MFRERNLELLVYIFLDMHSHGVVQMKDFGLERQRIGFGSGYILGFLFSTYLSRKLHVSCWSVGWDRDLEIP
jgi:hypothetical protein